MIAEKDPYIKSAYNQLQLISQDDQKCLEYEAREKAIHDYNQGIYEAESAMRTLIFEDTLRYSETACQRNNKCTANFFLKFACHRDFNRDHCSG